MRTPGHPVGLIRLHATAAFPSVVRVGQQTAACPRASRPVQEVTTVKNSSTSTCPFAMPVVRRGALRTGMWTAYGIGAERCAPTSATQMSVAHRNRTVIAPVVAAVKGSALLPIIDVVVGQTFGDRSGIRSWEPPV